jgi:hypothetical protein
MINIDKKKAWLIFYFSKFRLADQHAALCEETETTIQVNIQAFGVRYRQVIRGLTN